MGPKAVVQSHKHPSPPIGNHLRVGVSPSRPFEVISCFEKLAEPIFIWNGLIKLQTKLNNITEHFFKIYVYNMPNFTF